MHTRDIRTGAGVGTWSAAAAVLIAGTAQGLAQESAGLSDLREESQRPSVTTGVIEDFGFGADMEDEGVGFGEMDGEVSVDEFDLVDLHVNSEDLANVLQLLSIQSQRNIISSKNVSASVTADLYGVTFYEALDAILHVNGFGYIERGNFIYVYTREELLELERASRQRETAVLRLNYLNAADAAEFAKNLLSSDGGAIVTSAASDDFPSMGDVPIGADTYTNEATLVIYDFPENIEAIQTLVSSIDTKPVQVLVEATVLQTTLNEANAFGVDFAILNNMDFTDFVGLGGPLSAVNGLIGGAGEQVDGTEVNVPEDGNGSAIVGNPGNTEGPATFKAGIVNEDVAVFMRVLDQVTDITVVSNPKLLTLNRQPARVLVGTKVGYLSATTTETSTTQTVEFLDVGTQLAVRPFVSETGDIRLELRPQVSSFTLREVTDNNGASVVIPDEDTTELNTNVLVRDGQTVVLGGLFTETTTATRRQVPLIGDIPIIGSAFRGHDDTTRRSEIIFLITPSIVNDEVLAMDGDQANEYLTAARVGARKQVLPFSRERQVGQHLLRAREFADAGETNKALLQIKKALRKQPSSLDALALRAEILGEQPGYYSRSIMDHVIGGDWGDGGARLPRSDDGQFGSYVPDLEPDGPDGPDAFAEDGWEQAEPISGEFEYDFSRQDDRGLQDDFEPGEQPAEPAGDDWDEIPAGDDGGWGDDLDWDQFDWDEAEDSGVDPAPVEDAEPADSWDSWDADGLEAGAADPWSDPDAWTRQSGEIGDITGAVELEEEHDGDGWLAGDPSDTAFDFDDAWNDFQPAEPTEPDVIEFRPNHVYDVITAEPGDQPPAPTDAASEPADDFASIFEPWEGADQAGQGTPGRLQFEARSNERPDVVMAPAPHTFTSSTTYGTGYLLVPLPTGGVLQVKWPLDRRDGAYVRFDVDADAE